MGTKRPGNSKRSCRLCTIEGTPVQAGGKRSYYYCLHSLGYDTHIDGIGREEIRTILIRATNASRSKRLIMLRDSGLLHKSCLLDLETVSFPQSFPIDIMHCMSMNVPKLLYSIWSGEKFGIKRFLWELSKAAINWMADTMEGSKRDIPVAVGPAPSSVLH